MIPRLNAGKCLAIERQSKERNLRVKIEKSMQKNNIMKRCRQENIAKKKQEPCQRDSCQLN